jgi:hypothetical protein
VICWQIRFPSESPASLSVNVSTHWSASWVLQSAVVLQGLPVTVSMLHVPSMHAAPPETLTFELSQ